MPDLILDLYSLSPVMLLQLIYCGRFNVISPKISAILCTILTHYLVIEIAIMKFSEYNFLFKGNLI